MQALTNIIMACRIILNFTPYPKILPVNLTNNPMKPYTKTILCVDDDEDDLLMLREAINSIDTNYSIVEAFNGEQALELLQQMQEVKTLPCLIVLDINMPRMDGKQTLAHIKKDKELNSLPVVLLSTSNNKLDKLYCAHYGIELITKPSNLKSINTEVKKLLRYCV
jgi:CheY-like chemotaxis protein